MYIKHGFVEHTSAWRFWKNFWCLIHYRFWIEYTDLVTVVVLIDFNPLKVHACCDKIHIVNVYYKERRNISLKNLKNCEAIASELLDWENMYSGFSRNIELMFQNPYTDSKTCCLFTYSRYNEQKTRHQDG